MKNLSLAQKIGGGFALVLLLLVIVSFVGWKGLTGVTDGFVTYRGLARDTNLAGRLQANMLMVRMNVKDFIITGSEKDQKQYKDYVEKVNGFLETAHEEIQHPERAAKIDLVTQALKTYESSFARVVEIRKERDAIVNGSLRAAGPSMEKALTEIMASAKNDSDAEAAYEAGIVLRHMLLGRLYGQKFLSTNAPEDFDRIKSEFSSIFKGLDTLDSMLENPKRRALMVKVKEEAQAYIAAYEELTRIIYERNGIITNSLDKIGPQVAQAVEDVKLSVKTEQDELGPRLQKQSSTSITIMLIIACVALVIGIIISIFLTRSITTPVQLAVKFVQKIAGGDFTSKLPINQKDEIGVMAKALNDMVSELSAMIQEITQGVGTLSSSSTELASVSNQLMTASNETSHKAETVAAAAEEMSANINSVSAAMEQSSANTGMVASATEEMSATIGEIARSAESARSVSEKAVVKSTSTSEKMSQLGESANKIGRVTETITEISEQTNLLALNATIEAARAGEAGKGFAVVANEIKDLAKQTAEATVDIKNQIEEMQDTTHITVTDMNDISEIINDINSVINSIASAVEQQSAATTEISTNVAQVSEGIAEVNENVAQSTVAISDITKEIAMVNQASSEVDSGSTQVQSSAEELSRLAEQLDVLVKRFKV